MSTKKNDKKQVSKAELKTVAKAEPKNKNADTITLSDGSVVKRDGAFIQNDNGTFDRCTDECLLKDSSAAITIQSVDRETKEVKLSKTFGVHWRKTRDGGYLFKIATSKGLSDEVVFNESIESDMTLVGRGDASHAAKVLKQVWFGWSSNFGIESAFRIVRVELDSLEKKWYALLIPVTEVLG